MGWQDTFRAMDQVFRAPTYKPPTSGFRTTGSFGSRPSFGGRASGTRWTDLASGRVGSASGLRGLPAPIAGDQNPLQPGTQDKGLDTYQAALPFSGAGVHSPYAPPPPTAPASTQGDLVGSIQGALGSVAQNVNLGNALPWLMERVNVAAHDLADKQVFGAGTVATGTDLFLNAVDAAAQVAGPAIDAFPSWVRDSQLGDRAKLYRAIANGETPDYGITGPASNPLATLGELAGRITNPTLYAQNAVFEGKGLNPLAPLFGRTVSDQASEAAHWQQEILHAVDPAKRLTAEARMSILRDSIDLPESVKIQIERSPTANDETLDKWMNEAPEGKQWSYDPGLPGVAQNMATPIVFYLAEAKFGSEALGIAKGAGAASEVPGIARATAAVARAGSVTLKLQTAAVSAGMGLTAVNTTMGAIARYQGDEEAVAWFDHANRTTEFSDDPMVQLVTGFSVNPFHAANLATKGGTGKVLGWTLKHGIQVPLDRLTANKLKTFYSSDDQMHGMIAKMFKLGSPDEAGRFIDEQGLREQAHDMVMGTALDTVLDRLPKDERLAINGTWIDPADRAAYILERYGQQAIDLIERDPALVAARFHDYDWNYRMMPGPFNPEVAAKIALDYRRAMNRTYDVRARQGAVIGYREFLPPQGQALAREALDQATVDGRVPVRAVQELVGDFPALRKHWGGIDFSADTISRADADRMLELATAAFAHEAKTNPIRATTGADPVLRPDSPTKLRDYAESLGTSIETVEAWTDGSAKVVKDASRTDLLRTYLIQHADMDPAVVGQMTPDAVYQRAFGHISERTAPWEAMGERVQTAEKLLTGLQAELVRIQRIGGRTEHDVTIRIQRQIAELRDLVRVAGDPVRPFAAQAGGRSFRALRQKYVNAIAALERGEKATDPRTGAEVGPDQLKPLQNLLRDFDPADAGHNSHLAEMAARKVDAQDRLRVLNSLDEQLAPLELTQRDLDLVTRGADGELAWATEIERPPDDVVMAFGGFKTANQQVFKTVRNDMGKKTRQLTTTNAADVYLSDLDAMPASYLWAEIAKSPGFVKRMREIGDSSAGNTDSMTGNEIADLVESAGISRGVTGRSIDDIAKLMEEGTTREVALQRLAEMRSARDTALDGKGPAAIKRTAQIKVPDDYQLQAEADQAARSLVYDAEYEAFWHPRNIGKVVEITGSPDELYAGLRSVVEGDPIMEEGIAKVAARAGTTTDDVLSNPMHAAAVKAELVPADFEPPIEGMIREFTDLDFLIRANDQTAIADLSQQFNDAKLSSRPPQRVSQRAAERLAKMPKQRRSYQYRSQLSDAGADFSGSPSIEIMADPKNALGMDVLSVLNHGITGTKPATLDGVIALLRSVEDGDAGRMGIGPEMQAEAQRVGRLLMDDAVRAAKRDPNLAGTFTKGFFAEDEQALAATLDDLIGFDESDPLGTLQYGLKKAPKDAVVMEWSQVPGLAEELLSKRFKPYEERVGTTHVRQAFNYVFGRHSNAAARLEVKNRFIERVGRQGVTPATAQAVWERWAQLSHDSRSFVLRKTGKRRSYTSGDNPLYADSWNIPNDRLDGVVHGRSGEKGVLGELADAGEISNAEALAAMDVDFAGAFRESASTIRRTLADKVPLGQALADAYGMVAHNKAVTTAYYWFRFGLDIRYHAMNYFESQILYAGRAGLRKGEVDEGLLGQTEGYLRNLDSDPMSNTGYQFSRDRMALAYRTFLKEQPDALRAGLKGMASEDPAVMAKAMEQLARSDPQLVDMVKAMGDSPEAYLKELDAWHSKMLENIDGTADAKVIDADLAAAMKDNPELAQVYDRLGQVNKDLWDNIRETFYGNPDRSRAERLMNSYLLFWPLSYQIKSTKWFLNVLFDRAGGVKTNALGAVVVNQVADTHNRLLATDPEYRDWMEKHRTLVFVAQMMFPVSFDSTGVSLNPALRSMFFDRTKAGMEIGPIYTFNQVIRPAAEELYVDLYPSLGDMPLFDGLYRSITGKREPGQPKETKP